jgi:arylsulfatase A-like enzyme
MSAALATVCLEILYFLAQGWVHPCGYFILCATLSIGAGLVAVLVSIPRASLVQCALPAWAALNLYASTQRGAVAVAGACATWLVQRFIVRSDVPTPGLGVATAGAIFWAAGIYPATAEKMPPLPDAIEATGGILTFGGSLAAFVWLPRVMKNYRELTIGVLGLAVCASALLPAFIGEHRLLPLYRSTPELTTASGRQRADDRPNIFVLVLDTVAADHLSLYGYQRSTTPRLERWIEQNPRAAVYPWAFSNGNWTVPSHATLLTGLLPSDHGGHLIPGQSHLDVNLLTDAPTLTEKLRDSGYSTLAVYSNRWLAQARGLMNGFQVTSKPAFPQPLIFAGEWLRARAFPGVYAQAARTTPDAARVNAELLARSGGCDSAPCFVLANYMEAHSISIPWPECQGRFRPWGAREWQAHPHVVHSAEQIEQLIAHYDQAICSLDIAVVELFDALAERGLLDDSWIFLTSDHGESFGSHDVAQHGTSLYNAQVRVPLIIVPPTGQELPALTTPVSLIDVAATIAAVAGVDLETSGRDLRAGEASLVQLEFYGDEHKVPLLGELSREPARSVVNGRYKLIEHAARFELYDIIADPDETRDLAAFHPDVVADLAADLSTLHRIPEGISPEQADAMRGGGVSRKALEELRALGYVD